MRRLLSLFAPLVLASWLGPSATAQALVDTTLTWQGYARPSTCQIRVYPTPPDEDRTHTVVIREVAANEGPSTVEDARYLVERIGRAFGFDPVEAFFVFHWGGFSYAGADPDDGKEVFLRATVRRTKSGNLSTPSWRVISREEVEDLTDRRFR